MNQFYESIPSFGDFNGITDAKNFKSVPSDWAVFISDVRGSTKAIAEGKYKEVNMIGAASIVVTRNAMGNNDFPFVFGGDGATLIIPPSKIVAVIKELSALKILAKQNFNLDLRVGMIGVKDLFAAGKNLEVARFELTPGRCIAILRGNGLDQAEEWIKRSGEKYEVSDSAVSVSDLTGLSCRWQPIPSKNGKILSLIVQSRKDDAVFQTILKEMETIFPEGLESHNPANVELSTYKSFKQCLLEEIKYHKPFQSPKFFKRIYQILIAVLFFKYKLDSAFAPGYLKSIKAHSDFRKFDNMLRMVIDCSPGQIAQVKELFKKLFDKGLIYFGTFESENSLMTCFVDGLSQGQHIHFMDAENGGYAKAAMELKKQILEAETSA